MMEKTCLTCASFHHCDPDDVDGTDGYCCNVTAPGSSIDYGGHWTNSKLACTAWERANPTDESKGERNE